LELLELLGEPIEKIEDVKTKVSDRYAINTYGRAGTKNIFYLYSNDNIYYLPSSQYSGHFIANRYWIDFEPYKVKVSKLSGKYQIEILNENVDLNIRSVGSLNCINAVQSFTLNQTIPTNATDFTAEYNASAVLGETGWFNFERFDINTIQGVLLFFFILALLVCFVAISEVSQIPIFMFITGIAGFFFGIFIFVSITAIFGIIMCLLSIMYIIRSIAVT